MRKSRFALAVILFLVITVSGFSSTNRADISLLLDSLEHKFEWLDYRINLERWDLYTEGKADSLDFYNRLYNAVVSDQEVYTTLKSGKDKLTGEVDLRRWDIIHSAMVEAAIETNRSISSLRDSLSTFDIHYRAEYDGEEIEASYLYDLYRSHSNRQVRERAYRAWCSVGLELADGLSRLFRLRNQAARGSGYNNYLALMFKTKGMDLDQYRSLLKQLESQTLGSYRRILDDARRKLGGNEIEIWDFGYVYDDIRNEINRYFPVDSQMTYIKQSLKDIGFDIDQLPIYFDLDSREGKSQFAYAFNIKPPYDLRVMANQTEGLYSTRVLMHEIGHVLHSGFITQDNYLLRSSIDGPLSEGVAQIVAAFTDEDKWLEQYAKIPQSLRTRHLEAKQQQDIAYLRTFLMWLEFELEAYQNPDRDLNKLYWNLFEKYLLLPRHEDIKPWAAIIHYTTHPVYLQNYLLADILTAQTMTYLEKTYGDIIGNPMTKAFLVQNYMRFGGRYDWQDLLQRGTDEELNPEYLLDRLGIE